MDFPTRALVKIKNMKNLKDRIKQGETLHGCWVNLGSSITTEIIANAGFDWVLIDLEHGMGNEKDALSQIEVVKSSNAAALVRVESSSRQRVHRILDMGAEGIMCPHIDNVEDAIYLMESMYYPPLGKRGLAKMIPATEFGKDFSTYPDRANKTVVGIAQIESREALDHLDEIANNQAVDVLFIGPSDLTIDMGIFGEFDNPLYTDAVKRIADAASRAGKVSGILMPSPNDYKKYYELGMRFIASGADSFFVAEGARNLAAKMNDSRNDLK
jgi:4-hydroxy-2-oxoheptanedioate aldolase